MRWILEILIGILLFPFALIFGLLTGVVDFYSTFHDVVNKKLMEEIEE